MAINTEKQILQLLQEPATREQGFRLLVQTYGDRLYQHLRRMLDTHEDTDDVLQNTFVKAFRGIGNFKQNSQLYTWLYRIATNEALTHLDRRKRRRSLVEVNSEKIDYQQGASADLDGDYIRERLQGAIEQLPNKQKVVFSLRYFEEKPYQEMSEILGTSVGALKASYHHAVRKVEAALKL